MNKEPDIEPPETWTTILMIVFFVIPWLVGLGAIFNFLFDGYLW